MAENSATSATDSPAGKSITFGNCPLCEAHCGIAIETDPAASRVLGIRGDPQDAFSAGYICPKAHGLKGLHEDPDRLRRPLLRTHRGFIETSWDEALDRAADGLRTVRDAHGADAVASYLGNPTAHDLGALLYAQSVIQVLGSRWRFSATSVDQLPKMLSSQLLFGRPLDVPVPDIDHTKFLLVLGANPMVSNGSLMTAPDMPGRLRRLKQRGGRLVVVDPRRSETAAVADRHLFIRPGADALFLMSLVHVLFEEGLVRLGRLEAFTSGVEELRLLAKDFAPELAEPASEVDARDVRRLARELAAAPSAACYGRIGTCTQEFGTLASWLVDVVNVLTGNLDRRGGAMFPTPAAALGGRSRRRAGKLPYGRWHTRVRGLPEYNGELPVAALAEEIDAAGDERVRALFVLAGNPVLSTPNGRRLERALDCLDFMVSSDIYLNETSRHADVILPPVSPLERSNFELPFQQLAVRNGARFSPRALEPPEGAKQQWEILLELAARLGGVPTETVEELMFARVLRSCLGGEQGESVSEERARALLGDEPGPERLLDAMLRAGPRGDGFSEAAGGDARLSLAALRAAPHGVDFGSLEPRLPDKLNTASGRVELAPELLLKDAARLREALARRRAAGALVLVGRRQMRNNNSWMHNVESLAKGRERCTLLIHPQDAAQRGLVDGARARLRSRAGEIEVPVSLSDEVMPGVVSLPHGFGHGAAGMRLSVAARRPGASFNDLADEQLIDPLSGNAVLCGIPVEVTPD
jgi:anaerobic selenocysteine-containing dehydrogenase